MSLLVALPFLIPMVAGSVSLLAWPSRRAQRAIAVVGTAGQLIAAVVLLVVVWNDGIQVLAAGAWPAPYGITLATDLLSALMVLMTGITGFAAALYSLPTISSRMERNGYYPLMHMLLAGVAGVFLTTDLFNLYVWFEILLLASFALLAMGQERAQMAGALKYVVLNLFSSAMFLSALGLLYGLAGTLNMADLAVKLPALDDGGRVTLVSMLFMVAFSIKAASFPLFFWLPASYHTAPVAVSALFAGLLTKVGVYSLYRTFTLVFTEDVPWTHGWLQVSAGFTMVVGALGALAQTDIRRTFAFLHVSQIGYMLMGLALFTPLALAAGVFYFAHHIIMKSNLFFLSGVIYRLGGSYRRDDLGGLWTARPWLSLVFLVPALSLCGIPPLSGFWGKLLIVRAGVDAGSGWLVAAVLVTSVLTLLAVMRIWADVFWKAAPQDRPVSRAPLPVMLWVVTVGLAAGTLWIGFTVEPLWALAERASAQLLDPSAYIEAVLSPELP
ncbi:MAG: Na+/H+ antiporter subunit D [Polycyclovorans sp.]|nr:Na+/H+ antiporter subunit D [Polycyclovorans sp.]